MTISELVKKAHENAVMKGFYDCPECGGNGYKIRQKRYTEDDSGIVDYYGNAVKEKINCNRCSGTGKDSKKNIGELLMLIVSELGEALEAHRKGYMTPIDLKKVNFENVKEKKFTEHFKAIIKDTFEDELADVAIRLFDLCGYLGIDLEKHIELKMHYNETREYKHGKAY